MKRQERKKKGKKKVEKHLKNYASIFVPGDMPSVQSKSRRFTQIITIHFGDAGPLCR